MVRAFADEATPCQLPDAEPVCSFHVAPKSELAHKEAPPFTPAIILFPVDEHDTLYQALKPAEVLWVHVTP
jgi:hypothetical protein